MSWPESSGRLVVIATTDAVTTNAIVLAERLQQLGKREDRVRNRKRVVQPNTSAGAATADRRVMSQRLPQFRVSPTTQPTASPARRDARLQMLAHRVFDHDGS